MPLTRFLAVGCLVLLLAACSIAAPDNEMVSFESANPRFIDELLSGQPLPTVHVSGHLIIPDTAPPWPAVVMLHSASGQGAIDWAYAELLMQEGYAVLAVDSFTPRGVYRTVDDQTRVSASAMILDAFAARDVLAADPRVDQDRIAVLGFSKGGIAAVYSAMERVRHASGGRPFAAHVAHYPWCGMRLVEPATTGVPILIQGGGNDAITPIALCQDLVIDVEAHDPHAMMEVVTYADARHAFDHPALSVLGWVPVTGMIPGDCLIEEQADGSFLETTSRLTVTNENLAEVLQTCGRRGADAGGDADAATLARQRLIAFLSDNLQP